MAMQWRATVAMALAGLALAGLIGAQQAPAEGIASGTTRIELSRGLFKALRKEGVQLGKLGQGKVSGRVVTVPADGGQIDVGTANGWVDSNGGFRLRAGKRSVKVAQLTLDTSKGALRAVVSGIKLKIAEVESYDYSRVGFGDAIEVRSVKLNRPASRMLNRKLGIDLFRPTRAFASVTTTVQPPEVGVTGGSFRFEFDAGIVAKVRSLGFELTTLSSSGQPDPPVFEAPLLYGRIDPAMALTWGGAEGGFRIARADAPGPSVDWWNLGISFETGKLTGSGLAHGEDGQVAPGLPGPLAALDPAGASVSLDPAARTVSVSGARATLEAGAADYLNQTFAISQGKEPVFAAGDLLGVASTTMQGR